MRQDHLGGHAAEDEGHYDAEEDEVVFLGEGRVGRVEPGEGGEDEDGHRGPLEEDREDVLTAGEARFNDVVDAEGHMGKEDGETQEPDPDVDEGDVAQDRVGEAEKVEDCGDRKLAEGLRPDAGPVVAGDEHHQAGEQDALGRTVDVAQVKRVRVVGLPGREEHGQGRGESCEDARLRGTETECSSFEQRGECAIERVDAVVEELTQTGRGSGAASLLAVDIVESLVHEETESEAVVDP